MIIRRESKLGSNDLNVVYRPCLIEEMLGNDMNKNLIKHALDEGKVPHTQLFTGNAGCGKTTAARIIALGLNCETKGVSSAPCLKCRTCKATLNGFNIDVKEINVGQTGGKDFIDAMVRDLPTSSFNARYKTIILDEAHELTPAAKDLLLKPLEDGFEHVYFMLCTNNPEKLMSKKGAGGEAFLDRCSSMHFGPVDIDIVKSFIKDVCEYEGFLYNQDVLNLIAEESKGVPRSALRWLNQVALEGSWHLKAAKEITRAGVGEEDDPKIIELSRALNQAKFTEAVKLFDSIKTSNVESIRIAVSAYFVSCLKGSKTFGAARKFSQILDVLTVPIYEQGTLAKHKWYNYMFKASDIAAAHGKGVR